MRVVAGEVRKAGGTCGEGLGGEDDRDGLFSLLLDPTTSVGGEADEARGKAFYTGFF